MLIPLPPLEALRADRARAAQPMPEEGVWLQVAVLVHRAAAMPVSARAGHLEAAAALAAPETPGSPSEAVIGCATRMEDATRFNLALSTLDGVSRVTPSVEVERRGRVLAYQGRIFRQLGDAEAALARYRAAEAIGVQHDNEAVIARARVGFGVLARHRGNIPEARARYEEVLAMSGAAADTRQVAHHGLMVCAVSGGDLAGAAKHAWAAYVEATSFERSAALHVLSEMLLQSGHAKAALSGFVAAIRQPIFPRHELPALGGLAVAASLALPSETAWKFVSASRARVEALVADTQLPFAHASAMLEVSQALANLKAPGEGRRLLERARAIAATHQYHELTHRIEVAIASIAAPARHQPVEHETPQHILSAVDSLAPFETLVAGDLVLSSV